MVFWKKTKSREIRNSLKDIGKKTKELVFGKRSKKIAQLIEKIKADIGEAKGEILKRAEEEKSKPWIDPRFDPQIDALAQQEAAALEKLESDLDDYKGLADVVTREDEIEDVINALLREETIIEFREKRNERVINDMEEVTLNERMRRASAAPPSEKTLDGTPFSRIAHVGRQLGGWIVCRGGSHPCELLFPASTRPIPFSIDAGCERIANQIRSQIRHLPSHKIPTAFRLKRALMVGDIRLAA